MEIGAIAIRQLNLNIPLLEQLPQRFFWSLILISRGITANSSLYRLTLCLTILADLEKYHFINTSLITSFPSSELKC